MERMLFTVSISVSPFLTEDCAAEKLITSAEYRYQNERAASAAELSPPLQALLQVLDAIQPATRWTADERPNTVAFTPMEVDYNPIRLQSMLCAIYLVHPETPSTNTRYIIRPPRLRSDLRGDAYWAPWWRSAILVQSPTSLPIPSMSAHNSTTSQGYLHQALLAGLNASVTFLLSIQRSTDNFSLATPY